MKQSSATHPTWVQACQAHSHGDLATATRLYRQLVTQEPQHTDALYRLGCIAYTQGRPALARVYLMQAAALQPTAAAIHSALGDVACALGDLATAATEYQRAVQLDPHADDVHIRLGDALQLQGQCEPAVASYQQALRRNPTSTRALTNLGVALQEQGQIEPAIHCFRQALALDPGSLEALLNLGVALKAQGQCEAAADCLQNAIQRAPTSAVAYNNLGMVRHEQGQFEVALQHYRQAIQLRPDYAKAHSNLGALLHAQGRLAEAVEHLQHALRLQPDFIEAHSNLGLVLQAQGYVEAAIASFERALQYKPDCVQAHWNRAVAWLLSENFQQGWREYEWRWRRPDSPPPAFPQPRWDGTLFPQQTLLVYAEQGLGDTLQFVRYLPQVAARGQHVVLACQPALVRLLHTCPGVQTLVVKDRLEMADQSFDLHIPLLSLPGIFETTAATIPAEVPYLTAEPELVQQWHTRLGAEQAFRVGLVWAGNPSHKNDRNRSCTLATLAPLARLPHLTLFSLQTGPAAGQIDQLSPSMALHDVGRTLGDFADTAAVIAHLDLVITVDTAVAHLAGAMGKPVWTLLPFAPDWRWGQHSAHTPWYPTMRLFRQPAPGAWEAVCQSVVEALTSLLDHRAHNTEQALGAGPPCPMSASREAHL
jgi:tetratricopeptide (TPR) repeat protein